MKSQLSARCFAVLTALGLPSCTGQIGADLGNAAGNGVGNGVNNGNPNVSVDGDHTPACRDGASLGSARISLLSEDEYVKVIRDAFGIDFVPEAPPDGTYTLDESAAVASADVARKYYRAADQVATKVKPCGEGPLAAACVESFLRNKLPRVWKRPVTDAEITGLMGVFNGGLKNGRAMSLVMRAALGSGSFLYRTEVGADASAASGPVTLTPYELANALSFSVLGSIADDELWVKASDGTITQPAVLSAEVDRLLALQPARDAVTKRVSYYLNIEKVPAVEKSHATEFTPTLRSSLYQSAQLFINHLIWSGGSIRDLLTSTKVYANDEIAKVYGLQPVQGSALVELQMPPERNAGILTHPALLATTNPKDGGDDVVHRGLWIYHSLVCGEALAEPPETAAAVQAGLMGTDRVKAELRDARAECKVCHSYFDPFGFAGLNFDFIGRYRTIDPQDNLPVVTQSTIAGVGPDMDGPVSSLKDVADRLTKGRRLTDCAATNLAQYTLRHNPELENSCALRQIKDDFARSSSIVSLIKSVLTSPAFTTRDLSNQ